MRISLTGVMVNDQARAHAFYTEKLGFEVKHDIPMGEHRWLTVTSPDGVDGVELLLEPLGFDHAKTFQKALYEAGIPATAFQSNDIQSEYERLKAKGVEFRSEPQTAGNVMMVVFDDTCGNLICMTQELT